MSLAVESLDFLICRLTLSILKFWSSISNKTPLLYSNKSVLISKTSPLSFIFLTSVAPTLNEFATCPPAYNTNAKPIKKLIPPITLKSFPLVRVLPKALAMSVIRPKRGKSNTSSAPMRISVRSMPFPSIASATFSPNRFPLMEIKFKLPTFQAPPMIPNKIMKRTNPRILAKMIRIILKKLKMNFITRSNT